MTTKRCTIKVTANFETNLETIAAFLAETDAPQALTALLEELADSVIPNLERFPEMGRPFLDRPSESVEARERIERLESWFGVGALREYLAGDFLILYAMRGKTVYLLSIKHHRQLSFEFSAHRP